MRRAKRRRLTETADAMTTAWFEDLEWITSDCSLLAGEFPGGIDDDGLCKKSDDFACWQVKRRYWIIISHEKAQ